MTPAEMLPILTDWETQQKALETQFSAAAKLLGVEQVDGCPLWEAVFDVSNAHTVAVSRIVGDGAEWLQWYAFERNFGATPGKVTFLDGTEILVASVADLAKVICHD